MSVLYHMGPSPLNEDLKNLIIADKRFVWTVTGYYKNPHPKGQAISMVPQGMLYISGLQYFERYQVSHWKEPLPKPSERFGGFRPYSRELVLDQVDMIKYGRTPEFDQFWREVLKRLNACANP